MIFKRVIKEIDDIILKSTQKNSNSIQKQSKFNVEEGNEYENPTIDIIQIVINEIIIKGNKNQQSLMNCLSLFSNHSNYQDIVICFNKFIEMILQVKNPKNILLGWIETDFYDKISSTCKQNVVFMLNKLFIQNYKIMNNYLIENIHIRSELINEFQHNYVFSKQDYKNCEVGITTMNDSAIVYEVQLQKESEETKHKVFFHMDKYHHTCVCECMLSSCSFVFCKHAIIVSTKDPFINDFITNNFYKSNRFSRRNGLKRLLFPYK